MKIDPKRLVEDETHAYVALRDYLMKEEALAEDDQALLDTLEGETNLTDILVKVLVEARLCEAHCEALAGLIEEHKVRQERFAEKKRKLRNIVEAAMDRAGLRKIPDNAFVTASLAVGKPELIIDEEAAKENGTYIRTKVEVDKVALRRALEAGFTYGFARFGNGKPVLTVRFK